MKTTIVQKFIFLGNILLRCMPSFKVQLVSTAGG